MPKIYIDMIGWIGTIFYIIGILLIARKNIKGWYFALVGNLIYIGIGILIPMTSIIAINIIATGTSIYGIIKWKEDEKKKR